jgi:trans-aconitate 2-methyltransferase
MPSWDASQYLRFASERTLPAVDLAARICLESPRTVIDLGCGPGNSTVVLARRWPVARVTGLDVSAPMLAAAGAAHPDITWQIGDISQWSPAQPFDLVFSNAAFQWIPDHGGTLPRLFAHVAAGGALAFQVPADVDAPAHRLLREIGGSALWRKMFREPVREWHVEKPSFYYDTLAPHAMRVELWATDYFHVLPGPEAVAEWYRGTGARPWLDALPDEEARAGFMDDFLRELTAVFPPQSDGRVLFPFRRMFVIAYR